MVSDSDSDSILLFLESEDLGDLIPAVASLVPIPGPQLQYGKETSLFHQALYTPGCLRGFGFCAEEVDGSCKE